MEQHHLIPSTVRIDAHCHLFNKKVLSWRLLTDFVQSRVKLPMQTANNDLFNASSKLKGIKRALNFLKTGMQSTAEDVYKTLAKTEKGYAVVPLMFDLDYCMKGAPEELQNEIVAAYNQILEDDREELLQIKQDTDCLNDNNNFNNEIDELIQTIDNLLDQRQANELELDFANKENPFLTQEKQLIDLCKKHPGMVFPFFAVDPRRIRDETPKNGPYDLSPILNRLVINGGHFYGIKLYAPNGYSPADPLLMSLYEYCEQHAIPITAHCSQGGFASFAKTVNIQGLIYQNARIQEYNGNLTFKHYKVTDKERVHEKAQMLNHPLLWEKVLEKYPNLTLNLAHFGCSGDSDEWSQHIIRLMKKYPNLYTDLSCVADNATLDYMYKTYYSVAEPAIKKRFLYGSDFYLNMLFIDNMKEYVSQFEKRFSAAEMKEIAETNPRKFLSGFSN